jgi:hypothetical protein
VTLEIAHTLRRIDETSKRQPNGQMKDKPEDHPMNQQNQKNRTRRMEPEEQNQKNRTRRIELEE